MRLAFADPRNTALGWRILVPETLAQKVTALKNWYLQDDATLPKPRL